MTHMRIAPILNAAELMTHLEIQGCLDDSSSDDLSVAIFPTANLAQKRLHAPYFRSNNPKQ